jgi:hypothetical protein
MAAFNRLANFVQKGAVTGLFSVFAWQIYQIGKCCFVGTTSKSGYKRMQRKAIPVFLVGCS